MHIRRYLAGTVGVVALSLALFTGLADIKDGTSNTLGSVRALDGSSKEGAYIARVPVFDNQLNTSLGREPSIEAVVIMKDRDAGSPMI